MIVIKNKKDCCGCAACAQRCPKHCIQMQEDIEGFLYPAVNSELCIDCGFCEEVCPMLSCRGSNVPLGVYAAKNNDVDKRELSSSGGLFIALAEHVITAGGVVFGVVFDENWEAHHVVARTMEELPLMMRSKYIQSRTEGTFNEAEKYLKAGREVMYVGTSCQIAGLKNFLRKDYANLLTVDIICHGVPSPGVWRIYLEELLGKEKNTARSAATGKNMVLNLSLNTMPVITDISFREKHRSGYDWKKFGFVVWQKSADEADKNLVLSSYLFNKAPFMRAFLSNVILRPSCYDCPAKNGSSGADITIADFWGVDQELPQFYDESGVGLAIIHSEKGRQLFEMIDCEKLETTLTIALQRNSAYWKSASVPAFRSNYFDLLLRTRSLEKVNRRYLYVPVTAKMKNRVVACLKKLSK